MSNKYSFLAVSTVVCALALSSQSVLAQTTVFDDTFNNGSTINAAPVAPTANSASYEFAASQTGGTTANSIAPGDMNIVFNNTSSMFGEIMAQFSASPITLATIGDTIDLQVTFVDTLGLLRSGDPGSQLQVGLFTSGGVAPLQGQMLLNSATFASGGAKNWTGLYGKVVQAGTAQIGLRSPQTAGNSSVQDLLFNNATANVAFNSPTATILGTKGNSTNVLTQGSTYTEEIQITLTGASSMDITNTLYAGAGTGGTVLFGLDGTSTSILSNFDALAFGWRFAATAPNLKTNSTTDISEIKVTDDIAPIVPEPSSIALVGAGFGLMLSLIRRRRS